jgi:hypothetical protein
MTVRGNPKPNHDFRLTRAGRGAWTAPNGLNPLPRSVIRRGDFELLDGEWQFELDPDDLGLAEGWYQGHAFSGKAQWPGSIEEHMAAARNIQASEPLWQDRVIAWYERDFVVPADWVQWPDSMVQVTFGACGYETRVWLNGKLLRTVSGEEIHFGGYTSFNYELAPSDLLPVNRLTVRIAHSFDADIPRGKQESRVYKRGGIWYQTISGAVRSIWLEPIERNRLRTRLSVTSQIETGLVEVNLTTRIHDPGEYTLRLVAGPRGAPEPEVIETYELRLEAGNRQQQVAFHVPDARRWSPGDPALYQLVAQLLGPDAQTSQIETHFGLRKIETRGNSLYLNNEPIYLDGILYQPATSTYEQMRLHMQAMKALGCNLVRVHIAGVDPRIYDLADEMGMLLWVEVPSPHSSSQISRKNHRAELERLLVIAASHPSIIILSLYNEDWGAEDIAVSPETRRYIAETYGYLKREYPQFLVVDNDGWQHVSDEGRLCSDLLTAHVYGPDLRRWRQRLDRLAEGDLTGVISRPLVVGDPYFYRGQVPLIVSEWGGFGFSNYGGPQALDERSRRIREFKRELRDRPIGGDVYTQATSIEQEVNGVIQPETGKLLVEPGLLASLNLAEAGAGYAE